MGLRIEDEQPSVSLKKPDEVVTEAQAADISLWRQDPESGRIFYTADLLISAEVTQPGFAKVFYGRTPMGQIDCDFSKVKVLSTLSAEEKAIFGFENDSTDVEVTDGDDGKAIPDKKKMYEVFHYSENHVFTNRKAIAKGIRKPKPKPKIYLDDGGPSM